MRSFLYAVKHCYICGSTRFSQISKISVFFSNIWFRKISEPSHPPAYNNIITSFERHRKEEKIRKIRHRKEDKTMAGILRELMRYSRKGYIDRVCDIKNILKRFFDLTLAEVDNMVDEDVQENVKLLAQTILNEEYGLEQDYETMKEFGFLELLFLIDSTKLEGNRKYSAYGNAVNISLAFRMRAPMWYPCMVLVNHLLARGKETSNLFRMFSAINIRALFYYLEVEDLVREDKEEEEREWIKELQNEFYEKADLLELEIDCNSTMEDIFGQTEKIRNQSWSPGDTIEYYEERILNAYEILDCLLIEPFRYLYPEKFTMEYILGKYGSWFIGESCCG